MRFSCSTLCQANGSSGRVTRFKKSDVYIDIRRRILTLSYPSTNTNDRIRVNLENNISHVSDRFISEGKFSITLKRPRRVICFREISSYEARDACRLLNCIKNGEECPYGLTRNAPSISFITNLVINHVKDYPIRSSFPASLKKLHIQDVKINSFDTRILHLKNLSSLTIESSNISTIPKDIANLNLFELCLKSNSITSWPSVSRKSPLSLSLMHLDLSGNRIRWLPMDFWNLEQLLTLNLNDNELECLPPVNLHRVAYRLEYLYLRNNRLTCLPYAVTSIRSNGTLDLSGNPWITPPPIPQSATIDKPHSLFHLAALAFLDFYNDFCNRQRLDESKMSLSADRLKAVEEEEAWCLPERVAMEALGVLRRCEVCLRRCGPDSYRFLKAVELDFAQRVVSEPASVIHYLCSSLCIQRLVSTPALATGSS